MSISTFEKQIKASNGYVNSISKSIGIDKLTNIIENFPNLRLEWLFAEKGEMLKSDEPYTLQEPPTVLQEPEINQYRTASETIKDKEAIITSMQATIDLQKEKIEELQHQLASVKRGRNAG
ncbi:hypothetical protein [Pustulibacterium marinum]|nr:hypothetical protein [Pustulibacterium marinum]